MSVYSVGRAVRRLDRETHISERRRNQYKNEQRCNFSHGEPPSEWVTPARKRSSSLKVPRSPNVKPLPSPVRVAPARLPNGRGILGWREYRCSFRLLEWSSLRATWTQNVF